MKYLPYLYISLMLSTSASGAEEDHGGHHDFPTEVLAFHDVMAPLWHSPSGNDRGESTCAQKTKFADTAMAVKKAPVPEKVQSQQDWVEATEQLNHSVILLLQSCQDYDWRKADAALGQISHAFHELVSQVGHKH